MLVEMTWHHPFPKILRRLSDTGNIILLTHKSISAHSKSRNQATV